MGGGGPAPRRSAPGRSRPLRTSRWEITLQNPNRYPEAAAAGLRPWLERLVPGVAGEVRSARAPNSLILQTGPARTVTPPSDRTRSFTMQSDRTRTFTVRLASDREMRRVNRAFRSKDEPTDVLSFPGEPGAPAEEHLGDVLISVPAARRQAAAAGHPVARELEILALHGLLHCMGYDHETDGGTMDRLERRLRRVWLQTGGRSGDG
jgi:rRNA maturation RNase YbeY